MNRKIQYKQIKDISGSSEVPDPTPAGAPLHRERGRGPQDPAFVQHASQGGPGLDGRKGGLPAPLELKEATTQDPLQDCHPRGMRPFRF